MLKKNILHREIYHGKNKYITDLYPRCNNTYNEVSGIPCVPNNSVGIIIT